MFGASSPQPAEATSAQVAFSPSSSSVAVGGTVNVDITVADVTNLGGYDLHLQFNPAIVHVTSLTDAGFVTNNPNNIVVCNNSGQATIDNSAGTATESCATVSPFGPPGPGVSTVAPKALMRASFSGVAAGTSPLTLTGTTLQDPTGAALPATLGSGSITPLPDADGDGCPDVRELGPSHTTGGQRNPNSYWDFFDVPAPALLPSNTTGTRNRAISIQDVIAILAYIGTSAANPSTPNANGAKYGTDLNNNGVQDGQEYDRTPGAQIWAPGPPNGAVTISDALIELNGIGDNCN